MIRCMRPLRVLLAASLITLVSIGTCLRAETGEIRGCACVDRVGNIDCDYADHVDMADLVALIDHLFISLAPLPPCP